MKELLCIDSETLDAMIGWVSVDDRMPEQHTTVLCYGHPNDGGFYITINRHSDGVFRHWESDKENKSHISHWAPLPPTPGGLKAKMKSCEAVYDAGWNNACDYAEAGGEGQYNEFVSNTKFEDL